MTMTQGRLVPQMDNVVEPGLLSYPIAAGAKIYTGSLVAVDGTGGLVAVTSANASDGYNVVGTLWHEQGGLPGSVFDNTSGALGAFYLSVKRGIQFFVNADLTGADIFAVAYATDEKTVAVTGTTKAGFVIQVTDGTAPGDQAGAGAWVQVGVPACNL
jgi:hypothetical protein